MQRRERVPRKGNLRATSHPSQPVEHLNELLHGWRCHSLKRERNRVNHETLSCSPLHFSTLPDTFWLRTLFNGYVVDRIRVCLGRDGLLSSSKTEGVVDGFVGCWTELGFSCGAHRYMRVGRCLFLVCES